jgi:integrase
MRIYQRKAKGVWYLDYSFNGRRVRKKVGTSKKMAELALKEIELQIAKGEFLGVIELKKVVFDKLCREYLVYSKANKAKQSHRRDTTSINNLRKSFKGKLISEISAYDLEQYKNIRKDEVEPATVNREISCIKHMFTKAIHWDYLRKNPLRSVKKFREPPGRVRYLKENEIAKLLYCCAEHIKPVVITALNTGMRKGEILNLKWSDVDIVKRIITIRDSKNHESRHIPINDELYTVLLKLPQNSNCDGHVFLGKHGEPIRSIQNAWERTVKNAGITDFRFHDLRHTFASHLAMRGVDIRVLQELLGQKTIAMTVRYSHLSNKVLRKAVDKLNITDYNDSEIGTNLAQMDLAKK